jgi:hypothetical protein
MAKKNSKIDQALTEIKSGVLTKIKVGLQSLEEIGELSVLKSLVDVLATTKVGKEEIVEFLNSLKVSAAADEMIELIKANDYPALRGVLLSTLWNSKVDYSYFLADIVEIAVDGDFMEALECLTIIENMEGPFEERHILESQLHLREYLEDNAPKDPQKAQIMSEIAILLKDFDLQID